jgi:3-phenylpropionate/trans-cinnamate dioxygenase ferredoxin reductase subunit
MFDEVIDERLIHIAAFHIRLSYREERRAVRRDAPHNRDWPVIPLVMRITASITAGLAILGPMSSPLDPVVIIGAGLAGLRTAEGLRRRGYDGQIVLVGAEAHPPYDRPPLSKQILRGEQEASWLRTEDELAALEVTLRLGEAACELDVAGHRIRATEGEIPYSVAVIATGSRARQLPDLPAQVLRTLDDARTLRAGLHPGRTVVIVGAGLIGCEVAASARQLGAEVELVDVAAGPMTRVVGPVVAGLVARLHTDNGVRLHLPARVAPGAGGGVEIDGRSVPADAVVVAIGGEPETDWLAGSGLTVDDGVVCDADGRAGTDVYAVGDVARWDGIRHEHWTSSTAQADHAAAAILGQPTPSADVHYWWSDQYDLKIQGLGRAQPGDDVEILQWGPKQRTVAVYSDAGRLSGLVGFSAAGAIMRLRNDIAVQTPVAEVLERLRG